MRIRFTLRDLFWLILTIALALGWIANNRRNQTDYDVAVQQVHTFKQNADFANKEVEFWRSKYLDINTIQETEEDRRKAIWESKPPRAIPTYRQHEHDQVQRGLGPSTS